MTGKSGIKSQGGKPVVRAKGGRKRGKVVKKANNDLMFAVATIFRNQDIVSKFSGIGATVTRGAMIDKYVFTFAGCGSRRHSSSMCRCLLDLFRSTRSGPLHELFFLGLRFVEGVAQSLPLRSSIRRSGVLLLESLFHLLNSGLEGLQLGLSTCNLLLSIDGENKSVLVPVGSGRISREVGAKLIGVLGMYVGHTACQLARPGRQCCFQCERCPSTPD